jgi:hypothetical protein
VRAKIIQGVKDDLKREYIDNTELRAADCIYQEDDTKSKLATLMAETQLSSDEMKMKDIAAELQSGANTIQVAMKYGIPFTSLAKKFHIPPQHFSRDFAELEKSTGDITRTTRTNTKT